MTFSQRYQQEFSRLWRFLLSFSTRRSDRSSDRNCLFKHFFHLVSPLLGLLKRRHDFTSSGSKLENALSFEHFKKPLSLIPSAMASRQTAALLLLAMTALACKRHSLT